MRTFLNARTRLKGTPENCLIENPNISLDEAILKFEDSNNKYKNLEEFAKSKQRTVENYRKAYSKLFDKAKKELK